MDYTLLQWISPSLPTHGSVTFSSAGSYDPDGTINAYEWRIGTDPVRTNQTLLASTANATYVWNDPLLATIAPPSDTPYQLNLWVEDNDGIWATISATFNHVPNHAPNVSTNGPLIVHVNETVPVTPFASDPDLNDFVTSWQLVLKQGASPAVTVMSGTTTPIPASSLSYSQLITAPYNLIPNVSADLTLTATDRGGMVGTYSTTLTLLTNHAPVAIITGGPFRINEWNNLVLDGSASYDSDVGDYLASYQWTISNSKGSSVLAQGTLTPGQSVPIITIPYSSLPIDSFTLTLTVTDSIGATGTAFTSLDVLVNYVYVYIHNVNDEPIIKPNGAIVGLHLVFADTDPHIIVIPGFTEDWGASYGPRVSINIGNLPYNSAPFQIHYKYVCQANINLTPPVRIDSIITLSLSYLSNGGIKVIPNAIAFMDHYKYYPELVPPSIIVTPVAICLRNYFEVIASGGIYVYGRPGWFTFTGDEYSQFTEQDWNYFYQTHTSADYTIYIPCIAQGGIKVIPWYLMSRYQYTMTGGIKVSGESAVWTDHYIYTPSGEIKVNPVADSYVTHYIYIADGVIHVIPCALTNYWIYIPSGVITVDGNSTILQVHYIYVPGVIIGISVSGSVIVNGYNYDIPLHPSINVIPNSKVNYVCYVYVVPIDTGINVIPNLHVDEVVFIYIDPVDEIDIHLISAYQLHYYYTPVSSINRADIHVSGSSIAFYNHWTYVPGITHADAIKINGSLTILRMHYIYVPTSRIVISGSSGVASSAYQYSSSGIIHVIPSSTLNYVTYYYVVSHRLKADIVLGGGYVNMVSCAWNYTPNSGIKLGSAIKIGLWYYGSKGLRADIIVRGTAISDTSGQVHYKYIPNTINAIKVIPNATYYVDHYYYLGISSIIVSGQSDVFNNRWTYVPGLTYADAIKLLPVAAYSTNHWWYDTIRGFIHISGHYKLNFVTFWVYTGSGFILLHYSNEDPAGPIYYPPDTKHFIYEPGLSYADAIKVFPGYDVWLEYWEFVGGLSGKIIVSGQSGVYVSYIYVPYGGIIISGGCTDIVCTSWQYTPHPAFPISITVSGTSPFIIHYFETVIALIIVTPDSNCVLTFGYTPVVIRQDGRAIIIVSGTAIASRSAYYYVPSLYDDQGKAIIKLAGRAIVITNHYEYWPPLTPPSIIVDPYYLIDYVYNITIDTIYVYPVAWYTVMLSYEPAAAIVVIPNYDAKLGLKYIPIAGIIVDGGLTIVSVSFAPYDPTGGIVIGGEAIVPRNYIYDPTGGIIIGGTAIILGVYVYVPTGGIIIGGTAISSRIFAYVPTGGIIIGGEAIVVEYGVYIPTGGMIIGGSAIVIASGIYVPTGGIVIGGTAKIGRWYVPTGGIIIGGEAGIGRWYVPTGGIIIGGTYYLNFVTYWWYWPHGGIIIGGEAGIGRWYVPTGGIIVTPCATYINFFIKPNVDTLICQVYSGDFVPGLCLVNAQVGHCPMTAIRPFSLNQNLALQGMIAADNRYYWYVNPATGSRTLTKFQKSDYNTQYYATSSAYVSAMTVCQLENEYFQGRRSKPLDSSCDIPYALLPQPPKKSFRKVPSLK